MPSQGKDYSPFPSNASNTNNRPPSNTYANPSMNAFYYPYYTSDPAQYYSHPQYYSNYYGMPQQTTSYAQAYIDAAYSEAYPQVAPVPQESYSQAPIGTNGHQQKRHKSNTQQSKKNSNRLPVAYCNECSRPFYTELDYQNHLKCHVSCPDCGLTLTKKQLISHRNEAHPKLVTLDDREDIQSYIEERRGKYPKSKGKDKMEDNSDTEEMGNDQQSSKKRKMVVSVGYCKFYPLGKCKKGAGCPFYHEMPPGQDQKRVVTEQEKKANKSPSKKKETAKIVPKDRTKLMELLNEEYMKKEDSILLQVIRYIIDNKKLS